MFARAGGARAEYGAEESLGNGQTREDAESRLDEWMEEP